MNSFVSHMGNYAGNDPANQSRKGWLTSILELGAWIGTLLSGFMAEAASRKYGILIATGMGPHRFSTLNISDSDTF